MKTVSMSILIALSMAPWALGDELYLKAGNKFEGTVIKWGEEQISFVLRGTTLNEAFNIPVETISKVILNDSTEHVPGEGRWISDGEMSQEDLAKAGLVKQKPSGAVLPIKQTGECNSFKNERKAGGNDILIEGSIQKVSGYTEYHIKFAEAYYTWQSVLAFPVDGYKVNVKASLIKHPFKSPDKYVGFELLYAKNITDPETTMVDSDYVTYEAYGYSEKWVWSATQSTADLNASELCANLRVGRTLYNDISGSILLGYRYLNFTYDIYGVKGWQQPVYEGQIYTFDTLQSTNVLDYRVSYHLPFLGLCLRLGLSENSWLDGKLTRYIRSRANDEDDHILRYFKVTTSSKGSGWGAELGGRIILLKLGSGKKIFAGAGYEFSKISTTGIQTQRYYADDPDTPENEIGLTFTGIDNEINLSQQALTLFLGMNY